MEAADVVFIYKIVDRSAWETAEAGGVFKGAPIDLKDGYIHLSAVHQVKETAARHFAGQSGLLLVAYWAEVLGPDLRWEASRGGDHFPHLYGVLIPADAAWVRPLPLGPDSQHIFPEL